MFHTKLADKIKTDVLRSITFFFRKSCRLENNVEKHCRAGQTTDDNIIQRMRIICWITRAKNTHNI